MPSTGKYFYKKYILSSFIRSQVVSTNSHVHVLEYQ